LLRWTPYGVEGEANPCGIEQAEEGSSYWYLGYTPCLRANAAYSLYGILNGDKDQGCNRHTYINSFVTREGVEAFTQAVQQAGVSFANSNNDDEEYAYPGGVTSQCYYQNGEEENNENQAENEDGGNERRLADAVSIGLACDGKSFLEKSFSGAYCSANSAFQVNDRLSTFNNEISRVQCVPIYDKQKGYSGNYGDDQEGNNEYFDPVTLLSSSVSCDINEFPKQCPDPYGKLHKYSDASFRSTAKSEHPIRQFIKRAACWILSTLGVLLLVATVLECIENHRKDDSPMAATLRKTRRRARSQQRVRRSNSYDSTLKSAARTAERAATENSPKRSFWKRLRNTWRRNK